MKRILIINPFGLGDVLFSTTVVHALKQAFPDSFIGYICNRQAALILEHNPEINKVYCYTRGDFKRIKSDSRWAYWRALFKALRDIYREKFNLVVDLSLVNQYAFALWLIGAGPRWGFDYRGRGHFLDHKIKIADFTGKHVVDYYEDLLRRMGIERFEKKLKFYLSDAHRRWADAVISEISADHLIAMAPFGGSSWGVDAKNKQWPIDRFAGLAKRILSAYPRVKIALLGGPDDIRAAQEFMDLSGGDKRVINFAGKTDLGQLAALISRCDLFVGNDSGPLHIACAFDRKTVSIYGPADEKVYGPVGQPGFHRVASADTACRPCYRGFKKKYCVNMLCLSELSEDTVFAAVENFLKNTK